VWRFDKPGFTASFYLGEVGGPAPPGADFGLDWSLKLRPEGSVPPEMVPVMDNRVEVWTRQRQWELKKLALRDLLALFDSLRY
jgi:hypothetical protein